MKTSSKILLCLTGAALVALGIVCLLNPATTILSLAWLIGLLFLIAGCTTFGAWARIRRFLPQSGLMFFSALMQVIVGILLIANPAPMAVALPFVFAFWVLFEGLNITIESFDFKQAGFRYWWVILIFGLAGALLGGAGLCQPQASAQTLSFLVSIGIILNGIGYWVKLAGIHKFEKRLQQLRDNLSI